MTGVTALYARRMSIFLPPTRTRFLSETLTRELEDPIMDATSGHVVDLQTGQTVFGLRHDVPRHMASTTKLFTAGALLTHMGAQTTFTTTLLAEQPPAEDGVLAGDLIVVGGGDPLLGDDDFLRTGYAGRTVRATLCAPAAQGRIVDVLRSDGPAVDGRQSALQCLEDPRGRTAADDEGRAEGAEPGASTNSMCAAARTERTATRASTCSTRASYGRAGPEAVVR